MIPYRKKMKENKKLIRQAIEGALTQAILTLGLNSISRKLKKVVGAASKNISVQLMSDLKKRHKKEAKRAKKAEKKIIKKTQTQIK